MRIPRIQIQYLTHGPSHRSTSGLKEHVAYIILPEEHWPVPCRTDGWISKCCLILCQQLSTWNWAYLCPWGVPCASCHHCVSKTCLGAGKPSSHRCRTELAHYSWRFPTHSMSWNRKQSHTSLHDTQQHHSLMETFLIDFRLMASRMEQISFGNVLWLHFVMRLEIHFRQPGGFDRQARRIQLRYFLVESSQYEWSRLSEKRTAVFCACQLQSLIHANVVPLQWLHSAAYVKDCSFNSFLSIACLVSIFCGNQSWIPYLPWCKHEPFQHTTVASDP
jgi:hypothetical protein